MINGALLERVGSGFSRMEEIGYFREAFPTEREVFSENLQLGARFLDLGGERPQVRTYLSELQRSSCSPFQQVLFR